MAQMTVEEYRKKHKRCVTCVYVHQPLGLNARCKAKGIVFPYSLAYLGKRGMFCKVYKPKGVGEDGN